MSSNHNDTYCRIPVLTNLSAFLISNFDRNGVVSNVPAARIGVLATYARENEGKNMSLFAVTEKSHYRPLLPL